MKCLVTGIAGFAGSHLARLLLREGHEVYGIALPAEDLSRLDSVSSSVDLRLADITDTAPLKSALAGLAPDYIFHLAALASVPASLADPSAVFRVNALGTLNLLEAARSLASVKFLYVSSADVYGHVPPQRTPIRETEPPKPANPYAASKAAAEILCLQFWRTFALPVVILRPFNHTGPSQAIGFAPSDFASAVASIEAGNPPAISVGNLDAQRDYSDVRDIVKAYLLAALHCEPGEVYNIASSKPTRIQSLLDTLLSLAQRDIEIVKDPSRLRPSDTPLVLGDASKFRRRTGWNPEIPLEKSLLDLLDSWRSKKHPKSV